MTSKFDEMLSTFGYDALDLLFDVHHKNLTENDKRDLIQLGSQLEIDPELQEKIEWILKQELTELQKITQLLDLLNHE